MKDLEYSVMLFYKIDPDLSYYEGLTPLHIAAGTGQLVSKCFTLFASLTSPISNQKCSI